MKLRKSIFVGLALLPIIASAQQQYRQEIFIGSGAQLANWCLNEMRARYAAKDITSYGHASEHSVDGNNLRARVRLSVDGKHFHATCRVATGSSERYASFSTDDPRIQ